ncbi:MAG: hypothetical protein ACOZIN_05030 [Myxococcota bacterium]
MPSPERDDIPIERLLAALPKLGLGLLLITALWALWFQLSLPGRQVSEEDYRRIADVLASEAVPGDVVLLHPWWTERARLFVRPEVPVVGYQHSEGDALEAHPRVWLLSQPSLPNADRASFDAQFLPQRTRVGDPRRLGNLELTLFQNGRYRPASFSATAALASARVYLEGPHGRTECTFLGNAHRCTGGVYVAAEWHEIKAAPKRCLWMKPPGGPQRLVVELSAPPGELSLEAGLTWDRGYFKRPDLTAVHVGVDQAATGASLASFSIPRGLEGVQRAKGKSDGGVLKIWTQSDRSELRDVCVELFVYPGSGA